VSTQLLLLERLLLQLLLLLLLLTTAVVPYRLLECTPSVCSRVFTTSSGVVTAAAAPPARPPAQHSSATAGQCTKQQWCINKGAYTTTLLLHGDCSCSAPRKTTCATQQSSATSNTCVLEYVDAKHAAAWSLQLQLQRPPQDHLGKTAAQCNTQHRCIRINVYIPRPAAAATSLATSNTNIHRTQDSPQQCGAVHSCSQQPALTPFAAAAPLRPQRYTAASATTLNPKPHFKPATCTLTVSPDSIHDVAAC
jgi:hypothetical protein